MKRKKIKSGWKEYLTLSMRERRGLTILLSILVFQLIFLIYLNSVNLEYPFPDFDTVKRIDAEIRKEDRQLLKINSLPVTELSLFNPNQLPIQKWISLGLSEKQANSVLNYIKKGGSFKTKKDVKKIYGMNDNLYASIFPFIDLPDSLVYKNYSYKKYDKPKLKILEINTADSIELEKLKGIGPTLASRIVRYRDKLGGFIDIQQLKEVWGLNDTLFQLIIKQVQLKNSFELRYLYLNSDSFPAFANHPYVGRKLAGLIVNYRKQHFKFEKLEELRNLPLLTDEIFRKLAPYLKVD